MRPRGLACAAAAGALLGCVPPPSDPTIVLVVVDTLRADHLSLYGSERETSPALARFAERGAVFDRAFATSPWTVPSMGSLLTGRLPAQHGSGHRSDGRGGFTVLRDDVATLAEQLARRGFRTAAIVNNVFLGRGFGLQRGFEVYDYLPATDLVLRRADVVVGLALERLRATRGGASFLLVHLMDPHMAYDPAPAVRGAFTRGLASRFSLPVRRRAAIRRRGIPPPADRAFLRAAYDEEILAVDRALARLLRELDGGLLSRALVILTSDHGEELFEHGDFEHGHALHRELLNVPLVVWGEGVRPGRYAQPASLVDVAPTALDAVGAPALPGATGRSLWPLLTRGAALPPTDLVAESLLYGPERRAIVRWPFKLEVRVDAPPGGARAHLFDLESDPEERVDLARRRPELVRELRRGLERALQDAGPEAAETREAPLDDATRAQLVGLGYVE